ncbi:MAG: ComF family protein, partial [Duncaniella sp.]|nr:ComF family protein [Duncaniella sp.]
GQLVTAGFFDDIDVLIPVPLHFTKLWMRGYNQSHEIARGLSDVTGLPIGDNLIASRPHSTQTRKNASQRRANSIGTFRVTSPEELDSLHILVVDDVITTGSTILSALETIHSSIPSARLSVYSLALSKLR